MQTTHHLKPPSSLHSKNCSILEPKELQTANNSTKIHKNAESTRKRSETITLATDQTKMQQSL